jgi:tetratricopeptide (TPR) repeat protein
VAQPRQSLRSLIPTGIAIGAVLCGVALWRIAVIGRFGPDPTVAPFLDRPLLERALIPLDLLANYLSVSLSPHPLRPFYHRTEFGIPGVLEITILVALLLAIVLSWRRAPAIAGGLLWFALALVPVLNIVPIQETFAERFCYLPTLGLCLAGGAALAQLGRWERRRLGSLALSVLVPTVLIPIGLVLTSARNSDWESSLTLWEAQARVAPSLPYSHYQLAYYYEQQNILDPTSATRQGAIAEYLESLRLDPEHRYALEAHLQLGKLFMKKKDYRSAAQHFQAVLTMNPGEFAALLNLAYCAPFVPDLVPEAKRLELLEHARAVAPDENARKLVDQELARHR